MATIVLIQRDLRLYDNPALYSAMEHPKPVVVIYVMEKRIGSAGEWWLTESIPKFSQQLECHSIPLLYLNKSDDLPDLIAYLRTEQDLDIDAIYSNGLDFELPTHLADIHKCFPANLIFDPKDLDREVKVFTPYWKRVRANCSPILPLPEPDFKHENRIHLKKSLNRYREFPVITQCPGRWNQMKSNWDIGEEAAQKRYRKFRDEGGLANYPIGRDFFDQDGTSKLSPHFRFGEISVRQLYHELNKRNKYEKFLAELGWREFAHHVRAHHPDMDQVPINAKYRNHWPEYDDSHLEAWKKGRTGYPVIDAAMRCLWQTGWMHNRLRMLVGSFLTKNLMIPWQMGEQWFYDCLVDADPASNPFGWQWVAGCGTDSVPYFRIFNPILQAGKFDPNGTFVRRWIPELASIPKTVKDLNRSVVEDDSIRPDEYPEPIIDFSKSRQKALNVLKAINAPKIVKL